MKLFFKKVNKLERGFTFIETLVAVSIFTVSILSLFAVLGQSTASNNYAKTKIIGSYLTQEGMEYIRNVRDTFVLYDVGGAQTGWDNFNTKLIGASCQLANGCYFNDQSLDYTNNSQPMAGLTMTACGGTCPVLLYNATTGKYGYASGTSSIFSRKIRITQVSTNEVKVFSTVSWTHPSGNYNITFSENLFNWIQ